MAYEVFDGTERVRSLFGEGQGGTDEARDTLPQRLMEALDILGVPGGRHDGFVWCRRHDPFRDDILVGRERRRRAGPRRKSGPQLLRTVVTAGADGARHAGPRLRGHGDLAPWLRGLVLHAAPPLLGLHLQTPNAPSPWGGHGRHRPMSRQGLTAGDQTGPQPPATDAHRTAHALQGDVVAEEAFHQGALCVDTDAVVGV